MVDLFLTRDRSEPRRLPPKLDSLNQDRRATEAAALDAIELQLLTLRDAAGEYAPECIVLDHPEWHRGVLGILASRVVDRTRRPALVMTSADGEAHGSGRSIAGLPPAGLRLPTPIRQLPRLCLPASEVTPMRLVSRFPTDRLQVLRRTHEITFERQVDGRVVDRPGSLRS